MEEKLYQKTPLFKSHKLHLEKGLNVFYKMECFQPTNSFKIRGMDAFCRFHVKQGHKNFISSSGGNAGYSMAYAGMKLNAKVKVVVPKTTSQFMKQKIETLNAEVLIFGDAWDDAHQHALQLAKTENAIYVPPFDDELLWQGHSTIIDECFEQMPQPDKLIVSVGGGGLLCGILLGLKKYGWTKTQIITTETKGAASFYESFKANKIIELKEIKTVATTLGAKKITPMALELAKEFNIFPFVMDDEVAIEATTIFAKEYNTLVEPACGAALSAVYFDNKLITPNDTILVIACGGANQNFFN
jgi:L-serine/L-threonine ammonia-lyase